MSKPEPGSTERETDRIEAFSDGVFAIAITLLILDIKVPHQSSSNLLSKLFNLWPAYFAYILSFVMIGIYWAQHHYVFKLFEKTNHTLNLISFSSSASPSFRFQLRSSTSTCSTRRTRQRPAYFMRSVCGSRQPRGS